MDKKFPINDILVNDKLINKKQEAEHKHEDDISETTKIAKSVVQSEVTDDEEARNPSQFQNEENETDASNLNSVPPSPSTSSGMVSEEASSVDDIKTEELKEEHMKKGEEQPVEKSSNASSSKSISSPQGSVNRIGEPKKKTKEKVQSILNKGKAGAQGLFNKARDKLTKRDKKTSPSPSVDAPNVESAAGKDNLGFDKDK